jgi:HEAT repeat protein
MNALQDVYLSLLEHEEDQIREIAARSLLELLDSEVTDALLEAAAQPDHPGFLEILWLLGKAEDVRASEILLERLRDKDARVREVAASALAEIGDVQALQPLIEALNDATAEVRDAAAMALGELRDSRAIQPLIDLLDNEESQQVAAWALATIGDRRVASVLEHLVEKASADAMRAMAVRALGRMSDGAEVSLFIRCLRDPSHLVVIEACKVLGEFQEDSAADELCAAFEDTLNPRVRLNAAVALAKSGDPRGNEYLTDILQSDEDWGRRLNALLGLREQQHLDEIREILRGALKDPHWIIQKQAALALVAHWDEEVFATLSGFLGSEDDDIMQAVVEASLLELEESDDEDDEEPDDFDELDDLPDPLG